MNAEQWLSSVTERIIDSCANGGADLKTIRQVIEREREQLIYALMMSYLEVPATEATDDDIANDAGFGLRRLVEQAAQIARELGWEPHRQPISPSLRSRIYRRDGYACVECGADDVTQLTLDHRQPVALGGGNEADNLRTVCRACNSRKGASL